MSETTHHAPLDSETMALLGSVSTATLATQMFKRGFRNQHMTGPRCLRPDLKLVGTARTLRYLPAREDLDRMEVFQNPDMPQRWAVEHVGPGEVLVIDARGQDGAGTIGNILATRLLRRGAAGIVSDGCFRDYEAIRAMPFPTYARAPHANTNLALHHPVDCDLPIGCGGVLVHPGDVVVGDGDGVLVLPLAMAAEVARDAAEQETAEAFILERIESGASIVGVYPMGPEARAAYEAWRGNR